MVRAHVAKGEPAVWRIVVSPRALDGFAPSRSKAIAEGPSPLVQAPSRLFLLGGLVALALAYALLVAFKWRVFVASAKARGAQARALLPFPVYLRASLSGVCLAGAAAVALLTQQVWLPGGLVVLSMIAATQGGVRVTRLPRKPGKWLPLGDADAFSVPVKKLPGRGLDAGTLPGAITFLLLMGCLLGVAVYWFARSPYHAVLIGLSSACLIPIFCTGREAELPYDPKTGPISLLSWLAFRLRREPSRKVVAWVRIPDQETEHDELRLLVAPRSAVAGLISIEIGVEAHVGTGAALMMPWVMVRAREDSLAHRSLARQVVWSRGRKPEERAAILYPSLPTRQGCLALVNEVCLQLSGVGRAQGQPPLRTSTRSPGRGCSTRNAGTVVSPAHAI